MKARDILKRLIWLSHELGREDRQLAILGEGNVSADLGDGTFYVKASGNSLATIDADGFTRVKAAPIRAALDQVPELSAPFRRDPIVKHVRKFGTEHAPPLAGFRGLILIGARGFPGAGL